MELKATREKISEAGKEIFREENHAEASLNNTVILTRKSPKSTDIADERAKF